jgi:hypothetical protein
MSVVVETVVTHKDQTELDQYAATAAESITEYLNTTVVPQVLSILMVSPGKVEATATVEKFTLSTDEEGRNTFTPHLVYKLSYTPEVTYDFDQMAARELFPILFMKVVGR